MNFNIKHDLDLLTKSSAKISISDVIGLLERKKIYKQSGCEEYQDFRAKIKQLKMAKLPFRMIELGLEKKELREKLVTLATPHETSLRIVERINFLHGTNSAVLPMIQDTLEMIPTGRLLDRGRAPMGGEISQGGMEVHGVNQHTLSADTIRNISRCWKYASKTSNSFDPAKYSHPEELFLKTLEELSNTSPENNEWDCHIVTLLRLKQWNPDAFIELCQKYREKIELCKETTRGRCLNKGELQALKWMKTDIEAKKEDLIPEYIRDEFPNATCAHKTWKEAFSNDNHLATLFESFDSHMGYNTHEPGWKLLLVKLFAKDMMLKLESREAKEHFKYYGVKISKLCSGDHSLIYQKLVVEKMDAWVRRKMGSFQKRFDRLITLFDTPPTVRFSQQDRDMIEKPFGILFASTIAKGTESYSREEVNFDRAKLGSEIDLAFVTQDNIERMNQWVNEHGVRIKVLDSSLVTALSDIPLHHSPDQVQNSSFLFDKKNTNQLNKILNESVFPLYRAPYPNGDSRFQHGVPHAARTVLFAQVLMEMSGIEFKHKVALLVAMGLHDNARLDDGEDLWDAESGQLAKQILMKELKLTEEEANFFANCIADKDKAPTSNEQRIIHDGDCLEIMRCLRDPSHFKSSELRMNVDEEFIQEARLLIQLTENGIIKTFIENSPNPYQVLVQIISYSYEQKGLFRQICQHIHPSIAALAHPSVYQLNSEIENLCKQ